MIAADENHADAFGLPDHWRENDGPVANRLACPARLLGHAFAVNVGIMDDGASEYRRS